MAKSMTYAEQLRHPNWQRKRLEMLDLAGWECSNCGDKEGMLHVHHKRYVKGRKAWEYGSDELQVLCECCHAQTHMLSSLAETVLSQSNFQAADVALLAGFHMPDDWIERSVINSAREANRHMFAVGFIAYLASQLYETHELKRVIDFIGSMHEEDTEPQLRSIHDAAYALGLKER